MSKMKYCRLLMAVVLLVQLSIFQLISATATEKPLLLLDYTEIDGTHFVVNCTASNIPIVDVMAIPIAFNNEAVIVCGYDKTTETFFDIVDGVKTANEMIDASNGIIVHDSVLAADKWGGMLVTNESYPYIYNGSGIIALSFFSMNNASFENENKLVSIYFKKISDKNPQIRIASSKNALNYDITSDGMTFARWGELIDVDLHYSGDVFDGDYEIEVPQETPESNTSGGGISNSPDNVIKDEQTNEKEDKTEEPVKEEQEPIENEEKISFTDVSDGFWAYTPIMSLAENKIINGYDDNMFKPNSFITRAELAKIAVLANGSDASETLDLFTDVNIKSWYAPYLTAAYSNNIITGYPDKTFKPDNNISRQDLCVILYRTFFEGENEEKAEISFADESDIADYAKNAVNYLASKGILSGRENNIFAPTDNATRAETAKIVYLCLEAAKN